MKSLLFLALLILIPLNVDALTVKPASVTLTPDDVTVGDQPYIRVIDQYTDFDPNKIDTIEVVVKVKVTKGMVGTTLGYLTIQETGPNTRTFEAYVPPITSEQIYNIRGGQDNQWLEVGYESQGAYNSDSSYLYRTSANTGGGQSGYTGGGSDGINIDDGGGCLIATATYGTELAPQVQELRDLRAKLYQTQTGGDIMHSINDFYYTFSPDVADLERENPILRETIKLGLTPMLSSVFIVNNTPMDSQLNVITAGIGFVLLNVGMYFVAPAILIISLTKKFQ